MLIIIGITAWVVIILSIILIRPASKIHTVTMVDTSGKHRWIICVVAAFTVLLCLLPMRLAPVYNGEEPQQRNQYELMADAILEGHLYIDYDIDPRLLEMENPYDTDLRYELGVSYHHDHAFYNGHYYMYFGVVPVFLLFIPFRLITGAALTTYHATQVFTAFFIAGIFILFRKLSELFFRKLPFSVYLMLSVSFSMMSVWYGVSAPALYCTAITAAMCLCIWSFYFFLRAVWDTDDENSALRLAFLGSLLGALAFGCRPPVALANMLVVPMLAVFLRERKMSVRLFLKLFVAASPYIIIGALLMLYNYARFNDPFEFGQSYQLTVADQRNLGEIHAGMIWTALFGVMEFFIISSFSISPLSLGVFLSFPICFYSIIGAENDMVRGQLKRTKTQQLIIALFMIPIMISVIDTLWSPYFLPRYRMDIYWIVSILTFILIGFYHETRQEKARFSFVICLFALFTIGMSIFMFWWPNDFNYSDYFGYDGMLPLKILTFGISS